jgi:hypothetical protein
MEVASMTTRERLVQEAIEAIRKVAEWELSTIEEATADLYQIRETLMGMIIDLEGQAKKE